MSSFPAKFVATSSTEGASKLHVVHQGAQNQNATGLPVNVVPSSAPPATSGAENCRMAGADAGVPAAGALDDAAAPLDGAPALGAAPVPDPDEEPQDARSTTAAIAAVARPTRLRNARRTIAGRVVADPAPATFGARFRPGRPDP